MKKDELTNMRILPKSTNPIFDLRELGISHSPFQLEVILFGYIKLGDVNQVKVAINNYINTGFVVGRMSEDNIKQLQYWAVSSIAVATHYAILGGLDETDAYNLSDICIRQIDAFTKMNEIIPYLSKQALILTQMVADSKLQASYSPVIRRCIHYIYLHLHNKITISELAEQCQLSPDYFSTLFKKEVGLNPSQYIMKAKLEASKVLLNSNCDYSTICYYYAFCSESHYIACFKREYGITPKEYAAGVKSDSHQTC